MAFASEVDTNATAGVDDASSDVIQSSDDSQLSDSENGFYIHDAPIEINEGSSVTIIGEIMLDGNNVWEDLNFKYSYVDSNGVTQSKNLEYRPMDDTEFKIVISSLTAAKSPYVVTFSVIKDDLYDDFTIYGEIPDETVTITVIGTNTPIEDPALPEYTTITPEGKLYVDDSTGNDENDGSELAPYKTIQKALNQNNALGGNYEVIVNSGNYNVSGYTILKPVRLTGRGKVIIDANQNDYHFSASANTVEFYNLTFINGKGTVGSLSGSSTGGGSGNTGKVLNIVNCTFKDNSGMIGVLRTYATTTILNSNFINNVATTGSTGFGNIIYGAENTLTVNFCNFINNTPKTGKTTIDSVAKANANYNFWGSNNGPSTTDIGEKVTARAWVILNATLESDSIFAGNNYTVNIKNQYVKGEQGTGDLDIAMPDLEVSVSAEEGAITPASVVVSNNLGETTYTAPKTSDDAIYVKLNSNTLKVINVEGIVEPVAPEYVSTPTVEGNNSVEYTKESSVIVYVNITSDKLDAFFDPYGGGWAVDAYIDGVAAGLDLRDASEGSFVFDLKNIDDKLVAGKTYNITFRPPKSAFDPYYGAPDFDKSVFNNLTVTVKTKEVTPTSYDYETKITDPANATVDYVKGSDVTITVTTTYDSSMDYLGYSKMYAYINNASTGVIVKSTLYDETPGNVVSFSFKLSQFDASLTKSVNTIVFHPDENYYGWASIETYNYQTLTVNIASAPEPEYLYVSTPNEVSVNYTKGESRNVTFTLQYGDLDLDYVDIAVFIDGSNWKSGVVDADSYDKVVTIDLKDFDDDLSVGTHTVVVRHTNDMYDSNWDELGVSDCQFNALTVNVTGSAVPVIKYETTPNETSVEYAKGSSKEISVNITCDRLDYYFEYCVLHAYINGSDEGIRLNGVMADSSPAIVDLKLLSDYLEVGKTYSIVFRAEDSDFGVWGAPKISEAKFNPLTVTVTEASSEPLKPVYNVTYNPSEVSDYTKGISQIITVNASYNETKASAFENRPMYIYINGKEIKMNDVLAKNASFTIDLANYSDELVDGVNNISVHPQLSALQTVFGTMEDVFVLNNFTVTVNDAPASYDYVVNITGPASGIINYTKGNSSVKISVATNYDYKTMKALDDSKMYAFINGATNGIIVKSTWDTEVRGSALTFSFYLTQFDEYLTQSVNTIVFHPDENYYANASIKTYNYQTLTVNITSAPEPEYLYVSTPNEVSVNYTKGESRNVTFTLQYGDLDLDYVDIAVFIDGSNWKSGVVDADSYDKVVTIDLKDFDDDLSVGTHTVVVRHTNDMYDSNWDELGVSDCQFNALTVNVTSNAPLVPEYVSTPTVAGNSTIVFIKNSTGVIVSVNITSDKLDAFYDPYGDGWYVDAYIDGVAAGLELKAADEGSFTFDLKVLDNNFVAGKTYNITFRPPKSAFGDFGAPDFDKSVFNNLTVTVKPAEVVPEYLYVSTPNEVSVNYTKGESRNVTFTLQYGDLDLDYVDIAVFIDGSNWKSGVVDADSYDKVVTIDLKDFDDDLSVGTHTVVVRHTNDMYDSNWDELGVSDCQFNALTVNVTEAAEPVVKYTSYPDPSVVDAYINGSSYVIHMNASYDGSVDINDIDYWCSMVVYIDGVEFEDWYIDAETGSYDVDLKDIGFNFVAGNTYKLVFRPDVYTLNLLGIKEADCEFGELNVTVVEPQPIFVDNYTTIPSVNSIDYTIDESSIITVTLDYNETYAAVLGELPIFVYVGSQAIEINSLKANVTSFEFDLKAIKEFLTAGKNAVSFGPNKDDLTALISNVNATFNVLTVNTVNAPTDPNSTYVSTPTPSTVYYTLNESSIVTVSVTYDPFFNNRLSDINVFVYINGEDVDNRVKIDGVKANYTTFTFDLKAISDKLVEGQNNLTFHPHIGALEGTFVGPYVFNNLTVIVGASPQPVEPKVDYTGIIYVDVTGSDDNTGSSDSPVATIAKAIELASSDNNTEHKIVIREGTYKEHDLNITSALDISGEGNVIIDAQQLGRILDINTADAVNVSGITFTNGNADKGGAIKIKDAKVTIDNDNFVNNTASSWGAAIMWDANDGKLTNSVFDDNTCRNAAVVIGEYSWTARKYSGNNAVIENCLFNNNHNVEVGNCMGLDISGSNVVVKNTNFTNNKGEAYSEHGALYIKGDDVTVDTCLFENNSMGMAAAIQIDGEDAVIKNSKFINNTVNKGLVTRSGAIEVQNAAEIINNTFIANGGDNCQQGGAIDIVYANYGGDIVISNNKFINNTALKGAAIYVDGGKEDGAEFDSLTIEENEFDGNAALNGAGIYTATSTTPIDIENNKFTNNDAINGAGIFVDLTTVIVIGNNMSGNEANGDICSYYGEIESDLTLTFTAPSQAKVAKAVNLTATLVDDMGNTISGPEVKFTVNGLSIGEVVLVDGAAIVEFTPEEAIEYIISGSTDYDATVVPATINVILDATIEIADASGVAGNEIVVPVIVKLNGENVDNETISVIFDNKTSTLTVVNGTANVTITLPEKSGNYDLTVSYRGKEQSKAVTVDPKAIGIISITEINGNNVTGVLKDSNGNAIANATINYMINGTAASVLTKDDGTFIIEAKEGVKTDISFAGDNVTSAYETSITIKGAEVPAPVEVTATKFDFESVLFIKGYAVDTKAGEQGIEFITCLLDANGKPLSNKTVQLAVNSKVYDQTTNTTGGVHYFLNMMKAGRYTMTYVFLGDSEYGSCLASACVDLDKKPITIKASAKSYKSTAKTKKYTVTLSTIVGSSSDGKAHLRTGMKVTMKINGKTYTAKTDSKGKATFNLKITKKGKFYATISTPEDSTYKTASKRVAITIN